MTDSPALPRVFFPSTIAEALEIARREPSACYWAGGTRLTRHISTDRDILPLPRTLISLANVEELNRASRSATGLDIGAMTTLERLLQVDSSTLPAGMACALKQIGHPTLRHRATLGGHIAQSCPRGDLVPLLLLLDTSLEVHSLDLQKHRRKPVSVTKKYLLRQIKEDDHAPSRNLITQIHIPENSWNVSRIRILPDEPGTPALIFHALAHTEKSHLVNWRMAISQRHGPILRTRESEELITDRPLPLGDKDLDILIDNVMNLTQDWKEIPANRNAAVRLAVSFMKRHVPEGIQAP